MSKRFFFMLLMVLMGLMNFGCAANKPMNVTVELDDAMRDYLNQRRVEVNIVAVNSKDNERWETYSMTKYWDPGDTMHESIPVKVMIFDGEHTQPQTLAATDPIWNQWLSRASKNDNMKLYVLARLPRVVEDAPGDKDPRRVILPLISSRWNSKLGGPVDVRIQIQKTGVTTLTPPKPED